ncbi:MAG: hypothetical protein CMO35_03190 [Verrucomicrobiaceae bacterium]|nr:hypothetical protein [Verrucomicrobiaceae bacterium]
MGRSEGRGAEVARRVDFHTVADRIHVAVVDDPAHFFPLLRFREGLVELPEQSGEDTCAERRD